jgi:poly(A) polymerase
VTPAFLFAVLLWGEVAQLAARLQSEGTARSLAWQRAAHRVMAEQGRRVAIPRRFAYAIEEIWALQPRVAERTRQRVFRLMAHPRFRAAYDFLLMRTDESAELRESGEWWTHAQTLSPDELSASLAPKPAAGRAGEPAKPKRRRRRARRRRPSEGAQPNSQD